MLSLTSLERHSEGAMPRGTFGFSLREPPVNKRIHTGSVCRAR